MNSLENKADYQPGSKQKNEWFAKIRQQEKELFGEHTLYPENEITAPGQQAPALAGRPSFVLIQKFRRSLISQKTADVFYLCLRQAWRPMAYLAVIEIMIYLLGFLPQLTNLMSSVFQPLSLVIDFIVFVWLSWLVIFKRQESIWRSVQINFLVGFGVGFLVGAVKIVIIQTLWSFLALVYQAVLMSFYGVVVSLISSLVIKLTSKE